jgi:hypothetical protein
VPAARAVKEATVTNRMVRAGETTYQDKKLVLLIDTNYLDGKTLLGNIYIGTQFRRRKPSSRHSQEESHRKDETPSV